jgi:hypothetical protein
MLHDSFLHSSGQVQEIRLEVCSLDQGAGGGCQ